MDAIGANLRYINAGRLRTTADGLDGTSVVSSANNILGTFAGALVDPLSRRVRFLIVESRHWLATRQYILPFGTVRFDKERNALRVDGDAGDLREVRLDAVERFSDDDLIAAMFSRRAA